MLVVKLKKNELHRNGAFVRIGAVDGAQLRERIKLMTTPLRVLIIR